MPDPKSVARQIFTQTLASIDIPRVMEAKLRIEGQRFVLPDKSIDLGHISDIRVIAIGKAAHAMVAGLTDLLPKGMPRSGIVSAPTKPLIPLPGFVYFLAGHPTPDQQSWKAAEAILKFLHSCDPTTLVIFLLSGGGSALVELPLNSEVNLDELQTFHRALVGCGAPIDSIN